VEALDLTRRSGLYTQGSGAFPWGSKLTVDTLEYIIFSGHVAAPEPSTWWDRVLFTARLEIAAWAPRLHTVVRGTPVSGYRQQLTHSGGRVLRSGGLNHCNPSCPLVFLLNSPNRQTARLPPHLRIRAGAFHHPAGGFPHRHLAHQVGGLEAATRWLHRRGSSAWEKCSVFSH
jgi:hypothetical protein